MHVDIAGNTSFNIRMLISSNPIALFDGIFFRSASMISLVIGGIQKRTSSCIRVLTKFDRRVTSSDCVVTKLSDGSDVITDEVKNSLKASEFPQERLYISH